MRPVVVDGGGSLRLALRNLRRNRRRSLTTLLAMVVGVSAVLLFGGFSRDITLGLQTDFVQRSGHLQVQRAGYFLYGSGNSAAYGIQDHARLVALLREDPVLQPLLQVVTPTLQLGAIAGHFAAGTSRTVMVHGMVPAEQRSLRAWNDYGFPLQQRALPLDGTAEDAVVVGHGVARVLQLCSRLQVSRCEDAPPPAAPAIGGGEAAAADMPADLQALGGLASQGAAAPAAADPLRIEVLAANTHGAPNVGSFLVAAAEQQGVKELDDVHMAMHLVRAQQLVYGREPPQVTAVLVQLRRTADLPLARARITGLLQQEFADQPLELLDFAQLNPFYDQTNRMFSAIFGFVFALIGAIVLFVVGNTMSMAIIERTVEIGTLRAMGVRQAGIQRLFVVEGLLLGVAGAAIGVVAALLIATGVNHSGLSWTPPARIDSVALTVRVWGQWGLIVATFGVLAAMAGVSAWWPARRAARMAIVDALRHV